MWKMAATSKQMAKFNAEVDITCEEKLIHVTRRQPSGFSRTMLQKNESHKKGDGK